MARNFQGIICLKIPKQEIDDLKSSFLGPEEKNYLRILSEWVSKDNDGSIEVIEKLTTIGNNLQQSFQQSFQRLQDLGEENRGGDAETLSVSFKAAKRESIAAKTCKAQLPEQNKT